MQYLVPNGAMQTTAALVKVTTSSAIKTMLQIKPLVLCKVVEWGISFDGSAAATPGEVELIEGDVAATVTAHVAAGITAQDAEAVAFGDPTSQLISVGAAATGYTSTGEGTITSLRNLDAPQLISPTTQFIKQFPLGREPVIQANKFGRIRVTFGTAVNAYCWVVLAF